MLIGVGVIGIVIGALTGLLGAGGGILAVPALVYLVGIPLESAISTSLLMGAVGPLAALAPRWRDGVQWSTVLSVCAAGIPSAFAGTRLGSLIPQNALLLAFATIMVAAGIQMLRVRPGSDAPPQGPRYRILRGLAVGILVGFLTGLLGIGGGFITVPALMFILGLPVRLAIGSSLAIAVINSLAGIVAHAGAGHSDWIVAAAFIAPSMAAAFVTAHFSRQLSGRLLQRAFGVLVLAVAGFTVTQVILPGL